MIFPIIGTARQHNVGGLLSLSEPDYYRLKALKEWADLGPFFSPSDVAGLVKQYDAKDDASVAQPSLDWTSNTGPETATANGSLDYTNIRDSLLFEGQTGDFYDVPNPITATPFTVIAAVTPHPQSPGGAIFSASSSSAANNYFELTIEGGNFVVRARNGATDESAGTVAASTGLHVVAAEFGGVSSRRIKVDNGAWESNTNAVTPGSIDRNEMARTRQVVTDVSLFNGEIHRLLVYNAVVSDPNHTLLYNWMNITIAKEFMRDFAGFVMRDLAGNPMLDF